MNRATEVLGRMDVFCCIACLVLYSLVLYFVLCFILHCVFLWCDLVGSCAVYCTVCMICAVWLVLSVWCLWHGFYGVVCRYGIVCKYGRCGIVLFGMSFLSGVIPGTALEERFTVPAQRSPSSRHVRAARHRALPQESFAVLPWRSPSPQRRSPSPRCPTGVPHHATRREPFVAPEAAMVATRRRRPSSFCRGAALHSGAQVFFEPDVVLPRRNPSLRLPALLGALPNAASFVYVLCCSVFCIAVCIAV